MDQVDLTNVRLGLEVKFH